MHCAALPCRAVTAPGHLLLDDAEQAARIKLAVEFLKEAGEAGDVTAGWHTFID